MKSLKSINILLVEDEPEVQENYKEVFEYFFHAVYTASNGEEALDIFEKQNIQVVFTDYMMPKLDGYELCKKLKSFNQKVPIVMISNHTDKDKLQKCIPLGLAGYLFKPLTYEDIKLFLKKFADEYKNYFENKFFVSKNIIIDFLNNQLKIEKDTYNITPLESAFLKLIVENKNTTVNYDIIFETLFDFAPSYETLVNLVYRLKKKYNIKNIKNVKNIGYTMVNIDD